MGGDRRRGEGAGRRGGPYIWGWLPWSSTWRRCPRSSIREKEVAAEQKVESAAVEQNA
ncbi:hypothetical protein DVH05_017103 [Phytophthora capsici]|nr:hypothetical protein DVH05_017103 [Phytophthora capsici]